VSRDGWMDEWMDGWIDVKHPPNRGFPTLNMLPNFAQDKIRNLYPTKGRKSKSKERERLLV